MKTGGHFERCNVGSVEAHNERTPNYLASVKAAGRSFYFFHELTPNNTHWVNPEFDGITCNSLFEQLQQLYKEKTGQMPQLKDRERVNKKTGKVTIIAGWSPIREACIPIKADTTINDFDKVLDWLRQKGLTPIRLDLHKDEGYKDKDTGEVKMNYHAHLVVCWVDRQTGKTAKLNAQDMSEFNQVVLPNALGMEAGEAKAVTGKEHLTPEEQRKKAELERLAKKTAAEEERGRQATIKANQEEERAKLGKQENERLEKARIDKQKAIDEENGSVVLSFLGGGKYATLKKEHEALKNEYDNVIAENTTLRQQFSIEVKKATESLRNTLTEEKEKREKAEKSAANGQQAIRQVERIQTLGDLCKRAGINALDKFLELLYNGITRFTGWLKHGAWRAYADDVEIKMFKDECLLVNGQKLAFWVINNEKKQAQAQKLSQDIDDKPRRGQHL